MSRPAGFKIVHWSENEVAQLESRWLDLCDEELALLLGRTRKAVKEKRERLGLIRFEKAA